MDKKVNLGEQWGVNGRRRRPKMKVLNKPEIKAIR